MNHLHSPVSSFQSVRRLRLTGWLASLVAVTALLGSCGGGGSGSMDPVATGPTGEGTSNSSEGGGTNKSAPVLSLVLGHETRAPGNLDGVGPSAYFQLPEYDTSLWGDAQGNVYLRQRENLPSPLRKITENGVVTTLAVTPSGRLLVAPDGATYLQQQVQLGYQLSSVVFDGTGFKVGGPLGTYRFPAFAIDNARNLYSSDNSRAITISTVTGEVIREVGGANETLYVDGPADQARFGSIFGGVIDSRGNLIVADPQNMVIRRIDPQGNVSTVAGSAGQSGVVDGTGAAARFTFWLTVRAIDALDNVYVSDRCSIRRVSRDGVVGTLASVDECLSAPSWSGIDPFHSSPLTVDSRGNVVYLDAQQAVIVRLDQATNVPSILAGTPLGGPSDMIVDGVGAEVSFVAPSGLGRDAAGRLYTIDACALRRIDPAAGSVTTIVATLPQCPTTQFAVSPSGDVYYSGGDAAIRRVSSDGAISVIAGQPGAGGDIDGPGSEALFNSPGAIAYAADGSLLVLDVKNGKVRRISPDNAVSTLAAPCPPGFQETVSGPSSGCALTHIAVSSTGSVFVASSVYQFFPPGGAYKVNFKLEEWTPTGHVIERYSRTSVPRIGLGEGAPIEPGPPVTESELYYVTAMTATADGTIFVGDITDGRRRRIMRLTPEGVVSTYAGFTDLPPAAPGLGIAWGPLPEPIDSGTNVTGLLAAPSGDLYITLNSVLAKIVPAGE